LGWFGRGEELSKDPIIASYQSQTKQISHMKWVLLAAIIAGTLLMMIAVISPYIAIALLHTYTLLLNNPGSSAKTEAVERSAVLNATQVLSSAPKDVLPFATGLVGFAGGVIVAIFRTSTAPPSQAGAGQVPPPQDKPTADNVTIQTSVNNPIIITLKGTPPTTGDVLRYTVLDPPQHGTAAVDDLAASHTVKYIPQSGFTGSDSFTYKATDAEGADSNVATVTITVV
jgi:Big-like domain-containing protein